MIGTLFCIVLLGTLAGFFLLLAVELLSRVFHRDPQVLAGHIIRTKRAILRQMKQA
jgi:hypothetical protein